MALEREERLRQRRLAESAIGARPSELYDRLDKAASEGRRLEHSRPTDAGTKRGSPSGGGAVVAELPESHSLTWLHDVVGGASGWRHGFAELRRLADIERERQAMRETGHSHDHAATRHPTGYTNMDYYGPSILGDAIRRLHSRKTTGVDPAWWAKHQAGRRLQEEANPPGHVRRLATALFSSTLAAPYARPIQTVLGDRCSL
jgi:hypothetical protein